jgi:hypothetical protein
MRWCVQLMTFMDIKKEIDNTIGARICPKISSLERSRSAGRFDSENFTS